MFFINFFRVCILRQEILYSEPCEVFQKFKAEIHCRVVVGMLDILGTHHVIISQSKTFLHIFFSFTTNNKLVFLSRNIGSNEKKALGYKQTKLIS
jgi:hypothetical protein